MKTGSLGSMLQGVSQQPPSVRPLGKVTEQVNMVSDVVQGLTSRPALFERARINNSTITDYEFFDVTLEDEDYILGYAPGELKMWDLSGVEQTVTASTSALAYIGQEMQPFVFDNILYMTNRNRSTAKAASVSATTVTDNVGVVTVLGGNYSRTYTITITWSTGAVMQGVYTTPDGTTAGDANLASSNYIAFQLYTSVTSSPGYKAGSPAGISGNTMYFRDLDGPVSLVVADDDDQTTIRAHAATTEKLEDLAKTAPHGTLVRITGSDEGNADDFYMRFNSAVTDTLGQGFGVEGVWEEWFNPTEVTDFDLSTMPHVLSKSGPTSFTLEEGPWSGRQVGDEESNPFPQFIGYPIRDIGGFQSRLVFVGGPYLTMSRTTSTSSTDVVHFFKETNLTELDTDVINLTSTKDGNVRLDWIIPFDRDLVLMSDPGAGQFIITGGTKVTPSNASMVVTTDFEMEGGAKPVATGRTIMFPFKSGKFSGIQEFFTNDAVSTNGADPITEAYDRYIEGLVNRAERSTNFNMVLFATNSVDTEDTVWVYKYLWKNTEQLQSAMFKWVLPHKVENFFFRGSEVYFVLSTDGYTTGTRNYVFCASDLDIPQDEVVDYHVTLDRQIVDVVDSGSSIDLPYENARFVQRTGCAVPGREVSPVSTEALSEGFRYTFNPDDVPADAEVIAGLTLARWVKPTMPFYRDRQGNVVPRTTLTVDTFMLEYEETAYLKAIMDSKYRAEPLEFLMDWFPLDNDPADPGGNGLRSGVLDIPYGEQNTWSELTLYSDDFRPTTLIELEWTGQTFKGNKG